MTSPSTYFGPCPWPDPTYCCVIPTGAAAVSGSLLIAATEDLWKAGGMRHGLCTYTVRPCRDECWGGSGGWPFNNWWQWDGGSWPRPLLYAGNWYNITCGGCPGDCSCTPLSKFTLPAPIYQIVEIKIDGVVMPTGSYVVLDNQKVLRTDGGFWPACQDLNLADTENNTWSVTVTIGEEVPELGKLALGQLVCEYARACLGEACLLPKNVASLVRQGVSITLPTNEDWIRRLEFVDRYINYANPHGLDGAPEVYNIDLYQPTRWGT